VERVEEDSRRDRWFTAQEALDYGFIDTIVGSLDDVMPHRRTAIGLGAVGAGRNEGRSA
jgi:ATP-dependent Clp protease protease subunit